jgi:hypothetical protein
MQLHTAAVIRLHEWRTIVAAAADWCPRPNAVLTIVPRKCYNATGPQPAVGGSFRRLARAALAELAVVVD